MLASWQRTITDAAGNVVPNASVKFKSEPTNALEPLYEDRAGATPAGNPVTTDANGFVRVYLAGGVYRITVTAGSFTAEWRHVAIGTAAEFDVDTILDLAGTGSVNVSGAVTAGNMAVFIDDETLEDGGAPFSGDYGDLSNKPTLGTAAAANTGTSGATVPLLSTANTFGNDQIIVGSTNTPLIVRNLAGPCQLFQQSYDDVTAQSGSGLLLSRARGTISSPTAVQTGDRLAGMTFNGRATTAGINSGALDVFAAENFVSGSAAGTYYSFEACATGSTTRTQALRVGTGGNVYAPNAGTTASGANAFLDSGSSPANQLLRSTSRRDAKRDIEPADAEHVDAALTLDPVWYRSALPADDPAWSWYGLVAEEVAEIDPRLVHYGYADEAYEHELVEERSEVPVLDDQGEPVTNEDGTPRMTEVVSGHRLVSTLKPDAEKVPMGVAYDRVLLLQVAALKRLVAAQEARIAALEAAGQAKG